ncbi:hypothetical protein D9613_001564 [Agrocybe pediades]|uniref:Uncharacterized protein n=1 Tax=Agrocybe pediades TaxID=84607 RepID=A0A8H4R611_9AGAR|nr:hypothetical protein D9613_001564 [Agrocybe pediades]
MNQPTATHLVGLPFSLFPATITTASTTSTSTTSTTTICTCTTHHEACPVPAYPPEEPTKHTATVTNYQPPFRHATAFRDTDDTDDTDERALPPTPGSSTAHVHHPPRHSPSQRNHHQSTTHRRLRLSTPMCAAAHCTNRPALAPSPPTQTTTTTPT